MSALALEQLEAEINKMPSLPSVLVDIVVELEEGNTDIERIADKIRFDSALSVKLLAVANSAFYGFSGRIHSIKDACILLGTFTVKQLVLAAGFIQAFHLPSDQRKYFQSFWRHAIRVAIIAKALAPSCGVNRESAFTYGLLHDIGQAVMRTHFPDESARAALLMEQGEGVLEAEEAVFGFNHALVGRTLAAHWTLPEGLIASIAQHHARPDGQTNAMIALIFLANALDHRLTEEGGVDWDLPDMHIFSAVCAEIRAAMPNDAELQAQTEIMLSLF